jgi:hypothetical protein
MKWIKGNAVFIAALLAEVVVIGVYYLDIISFLWLNVIGAVAVPLFATLIQLFMGKEEEKIKQEVNS